MAPQALTAEVRVRCSAKALNVGDKSPSLRLAGDRCNSPPTLQAISPMVHPDVDFSKLADLIHIHCENKKEDSPYKRRRGDEDVAPFTGWWSFTDRDGIFWLSPQVDATHMTSMLREFASLLKKLGTLDEHLLSFITASRTVRPAMCEEAVQLREDITSLYHTIYREVEAVQNVWLTDPVFDRFRVRHPADLVLSSQYNPKDVRPLKHCIKHISTVLQKLDESSADMFSDTIIQPEAHLRTIFEPVKESVEKSVKKFAKKSVENLPEFLPVPYTIDHPLPDLIRQFNDFMSGITVVFAHWAENGVPAIIDDSQARHRYVSDLRNTSSVAIFFSGVSATALQYSGGIGSGYGTPFNFLWLLSLVLSMASAMLCQLGNFWHTSHSLRTQEGASHFVYLVTSIIPLILLGVTTAAFLTGLAFFSFRASRKHSFLAIGITSAICFVGAVMLWFSLWLLWRATPREARWGP